MPSKLVVRSTDHLILTLSQRRHILKPRWWNYLINRSSRGHLLGIHLHLVAFVEKGRELRLRGE